MSRDTVISGVKITRYERLTNTVNGNPRFRITFDNAETYTTQSDTGWVYECQNPQYRDAALNVTLTPAGRIRYARVIQAPHCVTCGQPIQKSWGGWGHTRKPDRRHVVRPSVS